MQIISIYLSWKERERETEKHSFAASVCLDRCFSQTAHAKSEIYLSCSVRFSSCIQSEKRHLITQYTLDFVRIASSEKLQNSALNQFTRICNMKHLKIVEVLSMRKVQIGVIIILLMYLLIHLLIMKVILIKISNFKPDLKLWGGKPISLFALIAGISIRRFIFVYRTFSAKCKQNRF